MGTRDTGEFLKTRAMTMVVVNKELNTNDMLGLGSPETINARESIHDIKPQIEWRSAATLRQISSDSLLERAYPKLL